MESDREPDLEVGRQRFNALSGRLRISVTHACQLKCKFCHQEGINSHWRPIHISLPFFQKLIDAFVSFGGREINLTGGDPLIHPNIGDIIEYAAGKGPKLAVCTNGLLLDRISSQIPLINEIKLSLHSMRRGTEDDLLGYAWRPERVMSNIVSARRLGAAITINFTLTDQNVSELPAVAAFAYQHGTGLLLIDLIDTKFGRTAQSTLQRQSYEIGVAALERYATEIECVSDRTGCVMRVFDPGNGTVWMIKDTKFGLLHTTMCNQCPVKDSCGEGVFALRVDAEGAVRPCLLRDDLTRRVEPHSEYEEVSRALDTMVYSMMR